MNVEGVGAMRDRGMCTTACERDIRVPSNEDRVFPTGNKW